MNYYLWGFGAVGHSFLMKLIENNLFDSSSFYCVDYNPTAKEKFIKFGGLESHFHLDRITKDKVFEYLGKLKAGDYLLDFCIDLKNLDVLRYCLENNIHYLSTADSSWNPDPSWISDHQHYLEYLDIKKRYPNKQNTCLIEFGMNPGMVSCFAKKCLEEIVLNDNDKFIVSKRNRLLKLIKNKEYGKVSKIIGVTDIQEVDNDDQTFNIPYESDTCYSTWNVWAYYYESVSSPELALGNKKLYFSYNKVFDSDIKDLYIGLYKSGYCYPASSYSPQGIFDGHICTHEEVFSIRKAFSYKRYRPTVHFIYSPSEYAIKSIEQFKNSIPTKLHLITKEEILNGGESVGIIIQGKHFTTRYFGNYLNNADIKESATILQVSSSAYAGFVYMLKHPNEGFLFPEDVDENEILNTAKPYLKEYISCECPKVEINLGRNED